jgi:hypothetical protein
MGEPQQPIEMIAQTSLPRSLHSGMSEILRSEDVAAPERAPAHAAPEATAVAPPDAAFPTTVLPRTPDTVAPPVTAGPSHARRDA